MNNVFEKEFAVVFLLTNQALRILQHCSISDFIVALISKDFEVIKSRQFRLTPPSQALSQRHKLSLNSCKVSCIRSVSCCFIFLRRTPGYLGFVQTPGVRVSAAEDAL